MRSLWKILIFGLGSLVLFAPSVQAYDHVVYSIYKNLDLGDPNDPPMKDYYVNMGTQQGLRKGAVLEVHRKVATYDLTSQKLYRDITFPIATLKVIHVESNAAIARLEKMTAAKDTPAMTPRAVMIGDFVRMP